MQQPACAPNRATARLLTCPPDGDTQWEDRMICRIRGVTWVSATCGGLSSAAAARVQSYRTRTYRSQISFVANQSPCVAFIGYTGEPSMPHFTVDMTVRDYELDQYGVGYLLTSQSCRAVQHKQRSHTLLLWADAVIFCTVGCEQCCVSLIPASVMGPAFVSRRTAVYLDRNSGVLALQVCQLPATW
jgi:hypothetical protein